MTREEKMELFNELLELEEKNDIGNLTSGDRAEFQMWVKGALEQEPKTGHWEFVGDNCYRCSKCGEVYTINQFHAINNYCDNRFPKGCPNCGCRMESEKNDKNRI